MAAEVAEKRTRGRRGGGGVRPPIPRGTFKQPRLPFEPTKILSDDHIEAIHNASLQVLEEIGIDVLNLEAKEYYRQAGAELEPGADRIRCPREMIVDVIATAPKSFTLHARNPAHDVVMGDNYVTFAQVSSAPNSSDMDGGRRTGNLVDYRNFLRLIQHFDVLHVIGGYPVEPVDIHASVRHLECIRDMATLTDKVPYCYSLGRERNLDALEMARIIRGVSDEELDRQPSIISTINTNSPLKLDIPMLQGVIEMAKRGQPTVITPFTLAGAMAPVTVVGALVQQNAEALAAVALSQLVKPGAPIVYGGFTSNVDMKSGAPAFGTPEYMKAALAGGQLARRYGFPYRTSAVCAANTVDAQAAWETVYSLWGALQGGGNLIKHSTGWLEGGLCASFEKFIINVDLAQEFMEPLVVDDDTLALDAMREVGPGGHFFGCKHTQERYTNAFYSPLVSDWRNFESWEEAGRPEAMAKANMLYKQALEEYEAPPLDPAIKEELDALVARRIEEGGVQTDF